MSQGTVAIVGLGLIGGSLGAALRNAGYRTRGYDISARTGETAARLGLVDELCSSPEKASIGAQVVVVAVPVLRSLKLLARLDQSSPRETVIIDTGSAKRLVVDAMSVLPGAGRMVGGHPLAGAERSGPAAADAGLFAGKVFFLTATPFSAEIAKSQAIELAGAVGAQPLWVEAAEHDHVLAATSHLPQILSSLLACAVNDPGPYSGPAFKEMTRLAGSDSSMWRDILLANADEIVSAGRSYATSLGALMDSIEAGDVASIERVFIDGKRTQTLVKAER